MAFRPTQTHLNVVAAGANSPISRIEVGSGRTTVPTGNNPWTNTALATRFNPAKSFSNPPGDVDGAKFVVDLNDDSAGAYNATEVGLFATRSDTNVEYLAFYWSVATGNVVTKPANQRVSVRFGVIHATQAQLANVSFTTSTVPNASATTAGVIEIADQTEGRSGTNSTRAMTSERVKDFVENATYNLPVARLNGTIAKSNLPTLGSADVANLDAGDVTSGTFGSARLPSATTSAKGAVEKSTSAENTTGTATDKFPDVAGVKSMIDTHASGGLTLVTNSVTTGSVTNGSNTYSDVGLSVTVNTTSVGQGVLLWFDGGEVRNSGYNCAGNTCYRNGTLVALTDNANNVLDFGTSGTQATFGSISNQGSGTGAWVAVKTTGFIVDLPKTTGNHTYKLRWSSTNGDIQNGGARATTTNPLRLSAVVLG